MVIASIAGLFYSAINWPYLNLAASVAGSVLSLAFYEFGLHRFDAVAPMRLPSYSFAYFLMAAMAVFVSLMVGMISLVALEHTVILHESKADTLSLARIIDKTFEPLYGLPKAIDADKVRAEARAQERKKADEEYATDVAYLIDRIAIMLWLFSAAVWVCNVAWYVGQLHRRVMFLCAIVEKLTTVNSQPNAS